MTFLAIDQAKLMAQITKHQLEFEEVCYSSQKQTVSQTLTAIADAHADDDDYDMSKDTTVISLKEMDKEIDSAIASIETRLKDLNAKIESYGKVVDNNIKNDCSLKISVGG